ncbi:MAG: DUF3341 domain-containing protein [Acidobacteria bacterium]|nr:DUF3341 domain-containing protein [Acidobacteriota bacterium]
MLKAIYGLYADPDSAQRAVDSLRAAGVETRDLEVVSSEPFEKYEFGRLDHRTPMPWLAALGGVVGGASGFLLASLTQKLYPLPTGAMPIVALWTNGIVTYEMTMLGAILATLLTLLLSTRLPDWRPRLYDREVSDGRILVGAVNPPEDSRVELERRLREAGALQVKDFDPALKIGLNPESEGRSS